MDALAFLPAPEVAARIRDGAVSAREVVEASIRRIEALDPQLGAFVELDPDGALAEADAIGRDDQRAFAGVPVAVKANTAVAGLCMNFASRFLSGHRPTHSAYLVRRLRGAGFIVVGTTNMPEFGILPTTESRHTGAGAQPVGHRAHARRLVGRLGGRGRRRAGPDRARQRRRRLAADPRRLLRPGRAQAQPRADLARARTWATRSWRATACSRARSPRPRSCSTCCRATSRATRRGRRGPPSRTRSRCGATRGGCGSRCRSPTRSTSTPIPRSCAGCTTPAELLRELGHEVEEASPALPGPDALEIFLHVFGPARGARHPVRRDARRAARRRRTRSSRCRARCSSMARELPSTGYLGALAQLQLLARGTVAFFADYDVLMTPVLASRPLPIGELHGCGEQPLDDLRRVRARSPRTRRCSTSPASRRSRSRSASARTACRRRCSSSATRSARRRCCRSRRRSRPRGPGRRTARRSPSASRRAGCGATPSASASAVPRGVVSGRRRARRLVPGQQRRGPGERLVRAQRGAQEPRRDAQRAAAAGERPRTRASSARAGRRARRRARRRAGGRARRAGSRRRRRPRSAARARRRRRPAAARAGRPGA